MKWYPPRAGWDPPSGWSHPPVAEAATPPSGAGSPGFDPVAQSASSTNWPSRSTQRFSSDFSPRQERIAETARSNPSRMDGALRTTEGNHALGSLSTAPGANASNHSDSDGRPSGHRSAGAAAGGPSSRKQDKNPKGSGPAPNSLECEP